MLPQIPEPIGKVRLGQNVTYVQHSSEKKQQGTLAAKVATKVRRRTE